MNEWPPKYVRHQNSIAAWSVGGDWATYPNHGKPGIRYEEYVRNLEPFWKTNRILVIGAEFAANRSFLLLESSWQWAPPFDGEEIPRQKRREIIDRVRGAYEYLGYRVLSEDAEVSAGLRERGGASYAVVLDGLVLRVTRTNDGAVKSVTVVDDGKEVHANLEHFAHWDAPRHRERIAESELARIFTLAGLEVAKHAREFVVDIER